MDNNLMIPQTIELPQGFDSNVNSVIQVLKTYTQIDDKTLQKYKVTTVSLSEGNLGHDCNSIFSKHTTQNKDGMSPEYLHKKFKKMAMVDTLRKNVTSTGISTTTAKIQRDKSYNNENNNDTRSQNNSETGKSCSSCISVNDSIGKSQLNQDCMRKEDDEISGTSTQETRGYSNTENLVTSGNLRIYKPKFHQDTNFHITPVSPSESSTNKSREIISPGPLLGQTRLVEETSPSKRRRMNNVSTDFDSSEYSLTIYRSHSKWNNSCQPEFIDSVYSGTFPNYSSSPNTDDASVILNFDVSNSKTYGQLYINGHAYTYLGLKCSTKLFFCTLNRTQPMYVSHQNKLSMYSNWKIFKDEVDVPGLSSYDSRHKSSDYTIAGSKLNYIVTHSSKVSIDKLEDGFQQSLRDGAAIHIPSNNEITSDSYDKNILTSYATFSLQRNELQSVNHVENVNVECHKNFNLHPTCSSISKIRTLKKAEPIDLNQQNYVEDAEEYKSRKVNSELDNISWCKPKLYPYSMMSTIEKTAMWDTKFSNDLLYNHLLRTTVFCPDRAILSNEPNRELSCTKYTSSVPYSELYTQRILNHSDQDILDCSPCSAGESLTEFPNYCSHIYKVDRHEHRHNNESLRGHSTFSLVNCNERKINYKISDAVASSTPQYTFSQNILEKLPYDKEESFQKNITLGTFVCAEDEKIMKEVDPKIDEGVKVEMMRSKKIVKRNENFFTDLDYRKVQTKDLNQINKSLTDENNRTCNIDQFKIRPNLIRNDCPNSVTIIDIKDINTSCCTDHIIDAQVKKNNFPISKPSHKEVRKREKTDRVRLNGIAIPVDNVIKEVMIPNQRPEVSPCTSTHPVSQALNSSLKTPSTSTLSLAGEGRNVCSICNKSFSKLSQLRLHINIHYFERPYRCENCAVSFRTKGHLIKHERSLAHHNKASMSSAFGTATISNPRPYKCSDCKIAFRIHGHLAKHLRSKMHIMKLECLGKLPFGTYAEIEKCNVNLNNIDTTDCDNSLASLKRMAEKLCSPNSIKVEQWSRKSVPYSDNGSSSEDDSDIPRPENC